MVRMVTGPFSLLLFDTMLNKNCPLNGAKHRLKTLRVNRHLLMFQQIVNWKTVPGLCNRESVFIVNVQSSYYAVNCFWGTGCAMHTIDLKRAIIVQDKAIFTSPIRNIWEGNVFTGVCLFIRGGGGLYMALDRLSAPIQHPHFPHTLDFGKVKRVWVASLCSPPPPRIAIPIMLNSVSGIRGRYAPCAMLLL